MITSDYIQRALTGVMRVSLHDEKALSWFEMTADGFFRSFWAIALSAPLYAYAVLGTLRAAQEIPDIEGKTVSIGVFLLLHFLFFVGGSLIFIAAMVPLSKLLNLEGRFAQFTIAYNWGTLAAHMFGIVPVLAYALGLIGPTDGIALSYVVLGFVSYLRFASLHVALGAPLTLAASLAITEALMRWTFYLLIVTALT
jgi:hypothetical protein